jgi:predicted HTH transcriptional regulator
MTIGEKIYKLRSDKSISQETMAFDLCNGIRIVIDGPPMRKEYSSYYKKAVREAILNCYCHIDYFRRSNIKIEFFDDRCEIISPGGFHGGLTLEEALKGVQSFRNKFLVQLLHKLGYI